MRYYKLDANGRVLEEYARAQPYEPELLLLPDRPGPYYRREDGAWVEDEELLEKDAELSILEESRRAFVEELMTSLDPVLKAAADKVAAGKQKRLDEAKDKLRGGTLNVRPDTKGI